MTLPNPPEPIQQTSEESVVAAFHPAVAQWFTTRYGEPTDPQRLGWPAIRSGRHTLISAPTGTGKTLAAFLAAIDDLVRRAERGQLETATQVVYVSPLKALSADIEKNLAEPLAGIEEVLRAQGLPVPGIRVGLRTGDTPAKDREAMIRRPPHILVTTPESLFILLTSRRGRELLQPARTVIVDEIHALMGDKRGSHLSLTLERLAALTAEATGTVPVRIGLSATQKPIEEVARFLVGTGGGNAEGATKKSVPGPEGMPSAEREAMIRRQRAECEIVDTGHIRQRDLAIEMPPSPLEAVMSGEVWTEVYNRLADLVEAHRTTLIFVNTRRLAERVARHLSERLGEQHVTAHHGSMSKEHRHDAEQRLKAGRLRALVATASLELGIDVGAIDLVCQVGSTKSIAAFLQRVGRSGHTREGIPKGRLFPLTRDELVECAALLDAVRRGELDRLRMPGKPLDILAQQIVAAAACEDWSGEALFRLMRRAWPYRDLERGEFDAVVEMLARGYKSGRGRQGAYLHLDAVNDRLRGRKGARHAAIVSGGAIPELASYDVVLEPGEIRVGSLDEDFAIESLPGDIFQLGNASWRILRVQPGVVRVADAQGQPPTIPFWVGEAPGRTDEMSAAVSRLREEVDAWLERGWNGEESPASDAGAPSEPPPDEPPPIRPASLTEGAALPKDSAGTEDDGSWSAAPVEAPAVPPTRFVPDGHPLLRHLTEAVGLPPEGALQLAEYLAAAKAVLGVMPTQRTLVLERFFDEAGGMQLVIHSPFGTRLNRAWGLALRKRFCRSFNFELQAAAIEDAIVLSLGPTHSFALDDVFRYLHSNTARGVLIQALLDAPMFTVRWRWNANRALAVLRRYGNRKVPAQLQRMRSDDLLALVFPDQQACLENIVGDREIPDHPLVNQTLRDCLEEAMDADGLERLLLSVEAGGVNLVARDLREPSPLAQEILTAKPYAFLDDAPLEERRTQAVISRRWLDPETAAGLGALDSEAIERVREEAWPAAGNADELHEGLLLLGLMTEAEGETGTPAISSLPPGPRLSGWPRLLDQLAGEGRAAVFRPMGLRTHPDSETRFWVAAEWVHQLRPLYPEATLEPPIVPPPALTVREWTPEDAAVELVRARLEACGPVTPDRLAGLLHLKPAQIEVALAALENEGTVFRGRFSPGVREEEWCERGLLARIHRYTLNRLRREIEPVPPADFMRFLLGWQRVTPGERCEGFDGLAAAIELLEGFEAPASAWESELLAARLNGYDREWLDRLCAMGQVAWARLTPSVGPGEDGGDAAGPGPLSGSRPRRAGPVASTPIALVNRNNLPLWLGSPRPGKKADAGLSAQARAVRESLATRGALFFDELASHAGLLPTHAEAALGELVARGLITADSFAGLRGLLRPARKRPPVRRAGGRSTLLGLSPRGAGRWSLLRPEGHPEAPANSGMDTAGRDKNAASLEAYAWVLLRRYGVVFRRLLEREGRAPPWRELIRVYRRLEARGEIRGGRFVGGMAGEQYALPEAVGSLRKVRRQERTGHLVSLSAADPLNLAGILTPGKRVAALTANRVLYRDGVPCAILEAGRTLFLEPVPPGEEWLLKNALIGHSGQSTAGNLGKIPLHGSPEEEKPPAKPQLLV